MSASVAPGSRSTRRNSSSRFVPMVLLSFFSRRPITVSGPASMPPTSSIHQNRLLPSSRFGRALARVETDSETPPPGLRQLLRDLDAGVAGADHEDVAVWHGGRVAIAAAVQL